MYIVHLRRKGGKDGREWRRRGRKEREREDTRYWHEMAYRSFST